MRYFGNTGPETPAMTLHQDLVNKHQVLDAEHDGLADYGIKEPEVRVLKEAGHTIVLVDESVQPGGAFKYISSAASVEMAPRDTTEFVEWTAGNFGITSGLAAQKRAIPVRAFVPNNLVPVKHAGMSEAGVTIVPAGETVEDAAVPGRRYLKSKIGACLLHAYDNPWGIAGLRLMGGHVSDALQKLDANGSISLEKPTEVLVGIGGGSAVAGLSSALYDDRLAGTLPQHVQVWGVRPRRLVGNDPKNPGGLNPLFDGLRVAVPGKNTAPFMEDQRFVRGKRLVGEAAVADGVRFLAEAVPDVAFESNAAVTVATALQWIADNPGAKPRNFVAVLTGRNTDPAVHQYFIKLPGYTDSQEYTLSSQARKRRLAAEAASRLFASKVHNLGKIAPRPRYGAMLRST